MRNTLKATTLESKLPLLAVEHGCIISKDADITVAFEVCLPELFTIAGIVDATMRKIQAPNHDAAVLLVSGSPDDHLE